MFGFILRSIWRLLVLALIILLTYATAFIAFPWLDKRFPMLLAILLLYAAVAYFAIPALIRFWRLVIKPNHIPLYVTTPDGWPADPVNIAIMARSKRHFIKAMREAGWYTADKATLKNTLREGYAILFDKPYPTAPFSSLYLFGRKFDIGFQLPSGKNKSPRHRHHVRFWQLGVGTTKKRSKHESFWLQILKRFLGREKTVWVGAALDDVGAHGLRWRNLQITHRNDPKHYNERDYIIKTLRDQGFVRDVHDIQAGEPFKFTGQALGNVFICDGYIKVVELKQNLVIAKAVETIAHPAKK